MNGAAADRIKCDRGRWQRNDVGRGCLFPGFKKYRARAGRTFLSWRVAVASSETLRRPKASVKNWHIERGLLVNGKEKARSGKG